MKKFFKLCMAVAALASMFGFASCSNDSSNDPTTTTSKTVVTYTLTIDSVTFTYTTTDGKANASDTVKIADDGTITITGSDGSTTVKVSKDGNTVTYVKGDVTYTGDMTKVDSDGNVSLTGSDGSKLTATAAKEEKKENASTPAASTDNVFKEKTFASEEGKVIFVFGSNGKVIFAQNKEQFFTEAYTVNGNDFSFTIAGVNKISGSLSGNTLTAGDAKHGKGTFTQTSGTNGFGGKSFISTDGSKLIVFVSDTTVVMGESKGNFHASSYTVSSGKVTGSGLEATLSGKSLTVTVTAPDGDHTDTGTLIE